jgi:hypothetical protein
MTLFTPRLEQSPSRVAANADLFYLICLVARVQRFDQAILRHLFCRLNSEAPVRGSLYARTQRALLRIDFPHT